jgi:hypothetical protein
LSQFTLRHLCLPCPSLLSQEVLLAVLCVLVAVVVGTYYYLFASLVDEKQRHSCLASMCRRCLGSSTAVLSDVTPFWPGVDYTFVRQLLVTQCSTLEFAEFASDVARFRGALKQAVEECRAASG